MNERIKKLLKQAGGSTSQYYRNLDDSRWSYGKIVNSWSEEVRKQYRLEPFLRVDAMEEAVLNKFVELIVKECADCAAVDSESIGNRIKDEFGVE